MVIIIITVILILLVLLQNRKTLNKAARRILFLFVSYWGVALTISSIGVPGLNTPSMFSLSMLLISVVMFTLGFLVVKAREYEYTPSSDDLHLLFQKIHNSRFFLLLVIIATVLSVVLFAMMRVVLAQVGDLGEVRTMYFDGSLFGGAIGWVMTFFLTPIHYICIPLLGYGIFFKRDWKTFLIAVFLLTYVSLGGGRFGYMRIAAGILFVIFCMFNEIKLKRKQWMSFIVAMVGLVYFMALVSNSRSTHDGNFYENTFFSFLHYLCGPMSAFDYAINNDYVRQMGGYTLGRLTFSSVDDLVYLFMRVLGFRIYNPMPDLIEIKQDTQIVIGDTTWNALYTAVLYYWLDGGIIGCVIFPFLIGIGFRYLVRFFYRYRTWPFLVILALFFQVNMHSVSDFEFSSPFNLILVLILFRMGMKRKINNTYKIA